MKKNCDNGMLCLQVVGLQLRCPFAFPIADACLTSASRRGGVGQAPVPSLDARRLLSRAGDLRAEWRVFCFLFFPFLRVSVFFFPSPRFSVSVLVTKKKNPSIMKYQSQVCKLFALQLCLRVFSFILFFWLAVISRRRVAAATWGRRQCRRSTRRLLSRDGDLRADGGFSCFCIFCFVSTFLSFFLSQHFRFGSRLITITKRKKIQKNKTENKTKNINTLYYYMTCHNPKLASRLHD